MHLFMMSDTQKLHLAGPMIIPVMCVLGRPLTIVHLAFVGADNVAATDGCSQSISSLDFFRVPRLPPHHRQLVALAPTFGARIAPGAGPICFKVSTLGLSTTSPARFGICPISGAVTPPALCDVAMVSLSRFGGVAALANVLLALHALGGHVEAAAPANLCRRRHSRRGWPSA